MQIKNAGYSSLIRSGLLLIRNYKIQHLIVRPIFFLGMGVWLLLASSPAWSGDIASQGRPSAEGEHADSKSISPQCLYPGFFFQVKDSVFFTDGEYSHHRHLWRIDNSTHTASPVGHLHPWRPDEGHLFFSSCNDLLFFAAADNGLGVELWRSDGTEKGTFMLKDINPGRDSSDPLQFIPWNDHLYFFAKDGSNRYCLWSTDGTSRNTIKVAEDRTGKQSWHPFCAAKTKDSIYFSLFNMLWLTDGSSQGTRMIMKMASDRPETQLMRLTALENSILFATKSSKGRELWQSDGTAKGTKLLKDIWEGPKSSDPQGLTQFGGQIVFSADDGIHGEELWISDGTTDGTSMMRDLLEGPIGSHPGRFIAQGKWLYFSSIKPLNNYGDMERILWRSDGTAQGTTRIHEFEVSSHDSAYFDMWGIPGGLYFTARERNNRSTLYFARDNGPMTPCLQDLCIGPDCTFLAGTMDEGLVFSYHKYELSSESYLGFTDNPGACKGLIQVQHR